MKEKETKLTIPAESAQDREGIDAEKEAAVSAPHTGEERSLAAGGSRDKEAEFDALIEGEYKEQFSKKVQKIISKRLREVKGLKETKDKYTQFVESLLEKFQMEDGDTEKLERMIDEKMTKEKHNSNEKQTELLRRLIAENHFLKRRREEDIQNMQQRSRAQQLREQAEETKKAYPEFEFEAEIKNPEFCRLLKVGVSVKNAYEVVNIDTILDKNSKTAERKVVDSIRSKGSRPVENGSEGASGILLSGNASKLTKKQREELAKRAAKGERISF